MGSIFEDKTTCEERTDTVVSSTTEPPDCKRMVRDGKLDPFGPSNSVQHSDRPRYGHDY